MEGAPTLSTTVDPLASSSDSSAPTEPMSSSDLPLASLAPPIDLPSALSSAPLATVPIPIPPQTQAQAQNQTLESPQQQQQQQQQQGQPHRQPQSQPQSLPQQPQIQQRPPAGVSRPRVSTPSMPRGGGSGSGIAIGVPAGYSHHQRPQSASPFSSFRPSNPFGSPPSFGQTFGTMPRSSAGGPELSSSSSAQARPAVPSVQTIGMIGSLSTAPAASQLRPGGVTGQNQQRLGQQVRSASPSANQTLNSQKFPPHGGPRASSMSSLGSQAPAAQGPQSLQQQWMQSQGKQAHASSLPTSSYRPQMRPPGMQQRPQHPQQQQQQHQLPTTSHMQGSASQQQQQKQLQQQVQQMQQQQSSLPNQPQEHHPLRNQPSIPPPHQAPRAPVPTTPKSSVQPTVQPALGTPANLNEPDELSDDIISRKRIRELVAQVDRSEKLRPEIEDDLLEIADDFVESIVTAACHLAKHRKSTTLEAKDILLHLERHWNMTLPGFSGDEIKCYKKPSTNDIHKERLAMVKKSMGGTNEGGNAKTPGSAGGQTTANPKPHATKATAPTDA